MGRGSEIAEFIVGTERVRDATTRREPTAGQAAPAGLRRIMSILTGHGCWPVRWLRAAFVECVMRPLVWLLAAPRVVRTTQAMTEAASDDPMLIIANHVTAYDEPLLLYALPRAMRNHIAAAMSGEMLEDFRHGRNMQSRWLNPLGPPDVAAAHCAVQCVSAASATGLSAQLCARRRGAGPRLPRCCVPRGNTFGQMARLRSFDRGSDCW